MIKNNISKVLKKCDLSQARLAEDAELSTGMVSQFASGRSIPTAEELFRICRELSCKKEDLYSPDVLALIYGAEKQELPGGKQCRGKNVRLTDQIANDVDAYGARYGLSRDQAARTLILIALREPEIQVDQSVHFEPIDFNEVMSDEKNRNTFPDDPVDG